LARRSPDFSRFIASSGAKFLEQLNRRYLLFGHLCLVPGVREALKNNATPRRCGRGAVTCRLVAQAFAPAVR